MLKELYDHIQALEKELAAFHEETAIGDIRNYYYPKKAELAESYYKLGCLLETRDPLSSIYFYWKAYELTEYYPVYARLFTSDWKQPCHDTPVTEEIPSFLQQTSSEDKEFLEAIQCWLGIGKEKSYETAFQKLQLLADKNHLPAMTLLEKMYEYGYFVKEDEAKAIVLYQKAADRGYAPAQYEFGAMYKSEIPLEIREKYNQLAAKQGYAPAQHELGLSAYYNLRREDPIAAGKNTYFGYAINQGYAGTSFFLGMKYYREEDIPNHESYLYSKPDEAWHFRYPQMYPLAVKYLRLAANQGHVAALRLLGHLYRRNGKWIEEIRVYREAAQISHHAEKYLLEEVYRLNSQVVPIGLQEIEFFLADIKISDEIRQEVYRYLTHRLEIKNHCNTEMIYCIHRILSPQNPIEKILETIPLSETLRFIEADPTLSPHEKEHYALLTIYSYLKKVVSSEIERESIADSICECISHFMERFESSKSDSIPCYSMLIDTLIQNQSLTPSQKYKIWIALLKKLGHDAHCVFLENNLIPLYCIQDKNGPLLYQLLIGFFKEHKESLNLFHDNLLKMLLDYEGSLENTLLFLKDFQHNVPEEKFQTFINRMARKFMENFSYNNFKNLVSLLFYFPNLNNPSFLELYPHLFNQFSRISEWKTDEEEKATITTLANYFLMQSQFPKNQDFLRNFSVEFLQAYFQGLYKKEYPTDLMQAYFQKFTGSKELFILYQFVQAFFLVGKELAFKNAADILMKAYLTLENQEKDELRPSIESEILNLIRNKEVPKDLKINLCCFLYKHSKQPENRKQVVTEFNQSKLNVSFIKTDLRNSQLLTPVLKILLLLDLIAEVIEKSQGKPLEETCAEILALKYLDEISKELKQWNLRIPQTPDQEKYEKPDSDVLEIHNRCKSAVFTDFIITASSEASTTKRWFSFIKPATTQFIEGFNQLQPMIAQGCSLQKQEEVTDVTIALQTMR